MASKKQLWFTLGDASYEVPDPDSLTFGEAEFMEAAFGHERTFDEIMQLGARGSGKALGLLFQIAAKRAGDDPDAVLGAASFADLSVGAAPRKSRPAKTRAAQAA